MASPTYAERILADARARAAETDDGRLSPPDMADWDIFAFEGDMKVKPLDELVLPEPPRRGEPGGGDCGTCTPKPELVVWENENWLLSRDAPSGLPAVVLLEPRGHYDLSDLPAELVREMGPMLVRVEQALLSLGGIARVHINRWGDGGEHLHWWFIARPAGLTQLRGSFSSLWMDVLPPRPPDEWDESMARIGAAMRAGD